jgi:hypothetical protein
MLDKDAQRAIAHVLTEQYGGRFRTENIERTARIIFDKCAQWEPDRVLAALDRHIRDDRTDGNNKTLGSFLPEISQLIAHGRDLDREDVRNRKNAASEQYHDLEPTPEPDDDRFKWIDLPPDAAKMLGRTRVQVDSWRSNCIECSDRGVTRFYHDIKDTARVWLFSEWLEMPTGMRDGLRCSSAVCDCQVGRFHHHRQATTTLWHKGKEHDAPIWPRLEHIRKLADRRKRNDLTVGG